MRELMHRWLFWERRRPHRLGSYLAAWAIVDLLRDREKISAAENNSCVG